MLGIDNKKIVRVSYAKDQVTKLNETQMTLLEMVEWFERVKERGANITPNGVDGAIVITDKRYFVLYVK